MDTSPARPITPKGDAIALFNGINLEGFYTWLVDTKHLDPRRVFSVTNGLIHISGDGLSYLATKQEYRDYRLVVEFKWGEKTGPGAIAWARRAIQASFFMPRDRMATATTATALSWPPSSATSSRARRAIFC
jgi:hypothetical protein